MLVEPDTYEAVTRSVKPLRVLLVSVLTGMPCPVEEGKLYVLRVRRQPELRQIITVISAVLQPKEKHKPDMYLVEFGIGDIRDILDIPRFLTSRSGTPEGDYTTREVKVSPKTRRIIRVAMPGEPEPLRDDEVQALAEAARERDGQRELAPLEGRGARLAQEVVELRRELSESHKPDRRLHRDLQRLEEALSRLLARRAQAA